MRSVRFRKTIGDIYRHDSGRDKSSSQTHGHQSGLCPLYLLPTLLQTEESGDLSEGWSGPGRIQEMSEVRVCGRRVSKGEHMVDQDPDSGTRPKEAFWVVRARATEGSMSLITRTEGKRWDEDLFVKERLLAVKMDEVSHWTWVKNPEKTDLFAKFLCGTFRFLERRKTTREELVSIKLSSNAYEGGKKK